MTTTQDLYGERVRDHALSALDRASRTRADLPIDSWDAFYGHIAAIFERILPQATTPTVYLYVRAAVAQRCSEGQLHAQRLYFDLSCKYLEKRSGLDRQALVARLRENIIQDGPSRQITGRDWLDAADDMTRYYEERDHKHDLDVLEDGSYR